MIRHVDLEMHLHRMDVSVYDLADDLALSTRQLERVFLEVTGMTMKKYMITKRFINAFKSYMISPQKNFHQLMNHENYYDQSHFIKNFKSFTGYSPEKLPAENFMFHFLLS